MTNKTEKYTLFPRRNLWMMAGCLALIIVGFLLMSGGSSSVEGGFNPDIFSTRRIVVGPTIAFLGFLLMAFSIIWTPGRRGAKVVDPDEAGQIGEMPAAAAAAPAPAPAAEKTTANK